MMHLIPMIATAGAAALATAAALSLGNRPDLQGHGDFDKRTHKDVLRDIERLALCDDAHRA